MGYYSYLTIEASVKTEKMIEVRLMLEELKIKIENETASDAEKELGMLTIDNDGYFEIEGDDWTAKWYNDDVWIHMIAPYLSNGDIEFVGEDGSKSGYRIIDGEIYSLYWRKEVGDIVKDNDITELEGFKKWLLEIQT